MVRECRLAQRHRLQGFDMTGADEVCVEPADLRPVRLSVPVRTRRLAAEQVGNRTGKRSVVEPCEHIAVQVTQPDP